MKTLIYATTALALIGAPAAFAADRTLGAAGGAAAGAATGAVVGGPVGAAVGGVAGAIIGANSVPKEARVYVAQHPVDDVRIEGHLSRGYAIPEDVEIHEIPDHPGYGYVYVEHRPVIVREKSREVVYAGPVDDDGDVTTGSVEVREPPRTVITYVERHHRNPVQVEGAISVGAALPETVELAPIPDDPEYAYVYTESGPVIVQRHTRTVVWSR